MFELIQKRFQTAITVALVLLLAAVFVIQFQAPTQQQGCSPEQTSTAARVYDSTITEGDFNAAYTLVGFRHYPIDRARTLRLRELTMDGIIERELLAHEGERLGFHVDSREVLREIAETGIILSTPPVDAPPGYPGPEIQNPRFSDRDGQFSGENMRRFIRNNLRRSVEEFERWQVRERLAGMTREAVTSTASVSPQEIRDQYVRETDRALIEYVRFTPLYYRDRVQPSDADLRTWMEEHTEEVDQEYQRQRHRYTGLEEQRRARHILIKAASDAPEPERAAARARAEQLLARARGGEDFAALASAHSEDTGSARRGGDLGWNPRGRMVPPFDEAQFGTEPGTVTDHVVETSFGFHVIRVEGRREGDVPEDEAKREVAETLYQRSRAGELAREEADRALAFLREGHSMQELDQRLAWSWNEPPPAPTHPDGTPGTAPEPPERDTFAPQVRESRSFGRSEAPIAGAANAADLSRAVFEMTMEAPLPDAPMQLGDDWYVFRLKERTVATDEGLTDEVRERIGSQLLAQKRAEVLRVYVRTLRERAEDEGALRITESVLLYGDEAGQEDEDGDQEGEEEDEDGESDEQGEGDREGEDEGEPEEEAS